MKIKFAKKGKKHIWIYFAFFMFIISYIYYTLERNIKPTIAAMSEIRARLIATQAINDAVNEKIATRAFDNLVRINTDKNGKVTYVQANTVGMNRLAAETSLAIQEKIMDIGQKGLQIPMGNILGSQIFANVGPQINIYIQPAGAVSVDFTTEFEEAGINQTRLKIYLIAKTDVQIIVPLTKEKVDVVTHIPVSETVIVSVVSLLKKKGVKGKTPSTPRRMTFLFAFQIIR